MLLQNNVRENENLNILVSIFSECVYIFWTLYGSMQYSASIRIKKSLSLLFISDFSFLFCNYATDCVKFKFCLKVAHYNKKKIEFIVPNNSIGTILARIMVEFKISFLILQTILNEKLTSLKRNARIYPI